MARQDLPGAKKTRRSKKSSAAPGPKEKSEMDESKDRNQEQQQPNWVKDWQQIYGVPTSLNMPTLLDLLVHAAPDQVLGDGGSLYLNIALPEDKTPARCPGCPHVEEGKACADRVYLTASTRDHSRIELLKTFYCTKREMYSEAGEQLEKYLAGPMAEMEEVLRGLLDEKFPNDGQKRSRVTPSGELPLNEVIAESREKFKSLFCPTNSGLSRTSMALWDAIRADFEEKCDPSDKRRLSFDEQAQEFLESPAGGSSPAPSDFQGTNTGRSNNKRPRISRSFPVLFRLLATLIINSRSCSSETEDDVAKREQEIEAAKKRIIWEMFCCHPLLKELHDSFEQARSALRHRFPNLGLSGWAVAFNVPVRFRSIENPFEARDYTEKLRRDREIPHLPIPLWGDRNRGHQDRLEREGRPFLGVPISVQSGETAKEGGEPSEMTVSAIGFLRVATKREGERHFTKKDEERFTAYTGHVARLLEASRLPLGKTDASSDSASSEMLEFYWALRLYWAVKGQSLDELGNIAARAFRELGQATAASLFLREDLFLSDRSGGGNDGQDGEWEGRRYLLWGTNIDETYAPTDSEARSRFDDFRQEPSRNYREKQGKTGWALSARAALGVFYGEAQSATVVIRLSPTKEIKAIRASDGITWEFPIPSGPIAMNLDDFQNLVKMLAERKPAISDPQRSHEKPEEEQGQEAADKRRPCEVQCDDHEFFLVAPLIDPDSSPEPLGIVRLIYRRADPQWKVEQKEQAILGKALSDLARRARRLSRLMRPKIHQHRLLRTVTELVSQSSNSSQADDSTPRYSDKHTSCSKLDNWKLTIAKRRTSLPVGVLGGGVRGDVAATLLSIAEVSAVSLFVRNDYAPEAYRSGGEESWVLVGAAAARDALTKSDQVHFENFCQEYFERSPGKCRYPSGLGRTGEAIKSRWRQYVDAPSREDPQASDFLWEVESPNALLIIPSPEKPKPSSRPNQSVIAVVRFIRTAERRRAKFLREEMDRLSRVVGTLQWLVPARAKQDEYTSLEASWRRESQKHFPQEFQDLLWELIQPWTVDDESTAKQPSAHRDDEPRIRLAKLRRLAEQVPTWVLEESDKVPTESKELDVEEVWAALLGRFLYKLNHTQPNATMVDIVGQTIRGLLRIHWEPFGAHKGWIRRLDQLEAFEPVLSEIPRYRDHSVHQFQVYLIGLVILKRLKDKGKKIGLEIFTKTPSETNSSSDEGKEGSETKDHEEVKLNLKACNDLRAWTLAAFFHDVAYPLQKVSDWANLFGRALTSTDDAIFVEGKNPEEMFQKPLESDSISENNVKSTTDDNAPSNPKAQGRFVLPHDTLVNGILNLISTKATKGPNNQWGMRLEQSVKAEIKARLDAWDHGAWAAIVLLDTTGNSPQIVDAAVAIALHTGMLTAIKKSISKSDKTCKAIRPQFGLHTGRTALSSLLMLCDALHEWGRDFRQGSKGGDKIEQNVQRPTLSQLKWLKKPARESETADVSKDTLQIDIGLGPEATGDQLLYKVAELKELSSILTLGEPQLQVRVSTIDPENLDDVAKPVHTITFRPSDLATEFYKSTNNLIH